MKWIAILLLLTACSHTSRTPSSESQITWQTPNNILELSQRTLDVFESESFQLETCVPFLQQYLGSLESKKPSDFLGRDKNFKELSRVAPQVTSNLFNARTQLRRKLLEFAESDLAASNDCSRWVRRSLVTIRYMEEYLEEWILHQENQRLNQQAQNIYRTELKALGLREFSKRKAAKKRLKAKLKRTESRLKQSPFSGKPPHLMVNESLLKEEGFVSQNGERFRLQSGDVLLSMGNLFASSLIARVGDEPGQFSHLGLVYIPPKYENEKNIEIRNQHTTIIEARMQTGTTFFTLKEYFTPDKVRVIAFRHSNKDLAREAAQKMHDYLVNFKDNIGKGLGLKLPIYDYEMNMADTTQHFCSELISHAYQLPEKGISVPLFKTSFKQFEGKSFLKKQMGITATETFAPGDIEVDPRFEIVGEWRDYSRIGIMRVLSVVIKSMFIWIKEKNYELKTDKKIFARFAKIAKKLRQNDSLGHFLMIDKAIPKHAPEGFIQTITTMSIVGQILVARLKRADKEHFKKHKLYMSASEMLIWLEEERQRDYNRWTKRDKKKRPFTPIFHKLFHPI